jgi:hypothetical protein
MLGAWRRRQIITPALVAGAKGPEIAAAAINLVASLSGFWHCRVIKLERRANRVK